MNTRIDTTYMGLELVSPIVVSACSLSAKLENIELMADCGAGAIVLFSLFEEDIDKEIASLDRAQSITDNFAEATNFLGQASSVQTGSERYLELIRHAKERVGIPIIASLNGISPKGWIDYAKQMEQAGADAIELNIFFIPTDLELTGVSVEQQYLKIVHRVAEAVRIPVAMKLNPYLSATGHVAKQMAQLGAKGLVLFNRLYQPNIDIERLRITSELILSEPNEIRLPLLWLAALHGRIDASLAATTGVHGASEVIKYLLAGADVVMTASALYQHGIGHLRTMHLELAQWMERKDFEHIDGFRGILSHQSVAAQDGYTRANYIRILNNAK